MLLTQMPLTEPYIVVCFAAADKTNLPRCSFSKHSGQTLLFCLVELWRLRRHLESRHINKAKHIPPLCCSWAKMVEKNKYKIYKEMVCTVHSD